MQQEITISIPVTEFADDPVFHLLEKAMPCQQCGSACDCIGFHERSLIYQCSVCDAITMDKLSFNPLFAADFVQAACIQHYEITCPYCQGRAVVVGGSQTEGLFFVCQNRCHKARIKTIRRY